MPITIGLISDTHGLLRASAMHALEGVELILHAGDVGSRDILIELRALAPVQAVIMNITDAELRLMASAAISGDSNHPVNGYRTPAAIGTPRPL